MGVPSKWGSGLRAAPLRYINCVDFEYDGGRGNQPGPVCMVVGELRSGETRRYWQDQLRKMTHAPFETGADAVMVAYAAQAELGCFLALGWPLPANVLDLYAEFRVLTNGTQIKASLLAALAHYNLPHIEASLKDTMRDLVLRGGWDADEKRRVLDYCQSDVDALAALLSAMADSIDWPRALIRGSYAASVASMEHFGVPIDLSVLRRVRKRWERIRTDLITEVDESYGVYDGDTFRLDRFSRWLRLKGISWPRLDSDRLNLSDDVWKSQEMAYPVVAPLRELRNTVRLSSLDGLRVGYDARARTSLKPFSSVTGRNQPSTAEFPFATAKWTRGFIAPSPERDLAYIDFTSQEIAIAAGLAGDVRLLAAYDGDDIYMAFAKDAGLVGPDATKHSHPHVRNACKVVVLGLNYGMGPHAMALQAGISVAEARELIELHKRTYQVFWKWSAYAVERALISRFMTTVFGWRRRLVGREKLTSVMNFPMQANGAEMMRVAAIGGVRAGIELCAPVHDAFLIAAPAERLEEDVAKMRTIMSEAGRVVCGVRVRTEAKLIRYPNRYMEERGIDMWNRVMRLANLRAALFEGPPTV
jgi:DNA polymerase-1